MKRNHHTFERARSGLLPLALLLPLLVPLTVTSVAPTPAHAATTVVASADTYVRADQPSSNFGTSTTLRVDGSPVVNTYLKYDVTGLSATPGKVTLRIWSKNTTSSSVTLHPVSNTSWSETGMTYQNAPAIGASLGSSGALTAGTWVSFDVTPQVTGNGTYAFAVQTTSSTSRTFDAREAGNKPQLVVEEGGGTPPPPPPPPPSGGPFTAVADTHVREDKASTNYGSATSLRVDGSPKSHAYLRFDVAGLTEPPGKVTLRIWSRNTSSSSVSAHRVIDTSWAEGSMTWQNAPGFGSAVGSSAALTSGTWATIDVTSVVTGDGTYSFALTTSSSTSRSFDSREASNKPQLVVQAATPPPPGSVVVAAAGDIACKPDDPGFNNGEGTADRCRMKATSDLVLNLNPELVFALGDLQYNSGELANFMASYDPTWGRFKAKTNPVIGNHEYGTAGAAGYFEYFGDAATPREPGCRSSCEAYYSFDVGAWHAVVLNSECAQIHGGNGCAQGSPQQQWLAADLAANPTSCTVALIHKPRWSSNNLVEPNLAPLVQTLYDHDVDLMLAGHSHSYERFAPQNPAGQVDNARGIRQIVVGTGGSFFTGFSTTAPNSEVRKANIFGVLKVTLRSDGYDWDFLADPTTPFSDSGSGTCH